MASIQKVKDVVVNFFNFRVFYLCFRRGYIPHFWLIMLFEIIMISLPYEETKLIFFLSNRRK